MKLQRKPLISVVIKGFDLHWLEVNSPGITAGSDLRIV